jgi:hypothetical protein
MVPWHAIIYMSTTSTNIDDYADRSVLDHKIASTPQLVQKERLQSKVQFLQFQWGRLVIWQFWDVPMHSNRKCTQPYAHLFFRKDLAKNSTLLWFNPRRTEKNLTNNFKINHRSDVSPIARKKIRDKMLVESKDEQLENFQNSLLGKLRGSTRTWLMVGFLSKTKKLQRSGKSWNGFQQL